MRCTGWLEDVPEDIQQEICYVQIPGDDTIQLTADTTTFIQDVQSGGLLRRVEGDHAFYQQSKVDLSTVATTNLGVLAAAKAGASIAGALPGGVCHGARVHLYAGDGAGMAPHQDMATGSAHPCPFPIPECPHACLRNQACMAVTANDVKPPCPR